MSHNFSMLEGSLATFQNVLDFNKPASSLIRHDVHFSIELVINGPPYAGEWGPPWFISFSYALYEVRVQFYKRRPVVLVIS